MWINPQLKIVHKTNAPFTPVLVKFAESVQLFCEISEENDLVLKMYVSG